MSHEALGKTEKGKVTRPNVWFVGVTPSRNPELVVAVLWQNGEFSYYPARIGAKIVSAYVEKQRRLANNLQPSKTQAPVEMSAVWTTPGESAEAKNGPRNALKPAMQTGSFLVDHGEIVSKAAPDPHVASRSQSASAHRAASPSQVGATVPAVTGKGQ
jgi:hypothetical protein